MAIAYDKRRKLTLIV